MTLYDESIEFAICDPDEDIMSEADFVDIQLKVCAEDLARKLGVDQIHTRQILEHLMDLDCGIIWPEYDPDEPDMDATLHFEPSPYDAIEACWTPEEILNAFAGDSIEHTVAMTNFVTSLANPLLTPLICLEDMVNFLGDARRYLEENRSHLIKTGFPEKKYPGPLWLGNLVVNLYCTRLPSKIIEESDDSLSYRWDRRRRASGQHATALEGMSTGDVHALVDLRDRLLTLKIAILIELETSLINGDSATLWKRCVNQFTSALKASELKFLFRIDRSHCRCAIDTRYFQGTPQTGLIGGRVSDLLYLIGYIEGEMTVGYYSRLYEAFHDVLTIDPFGAPRLPSGNYFTWLKRPDSYRLTRVVFEVNKKYLEDYTKHWANHRDRISSGLLEAFADNYLLPPSFDVRLLQKESAQAATAKLIANSITLMTDDEGVLTVLAGAYRYEFIRDDQKKSIQFMHFLHLNGRLDIPQANILRQLDLPPPTEKHKYRQLRDKFRSHKAWGSLIIAGVMTGSYRLNIPS